MSDSQTGKIIAAVIDGRVGNKTLTKGTDNWADVKMQWISGLCKLVTACVISLKKLIVVKSPSLSRFHAPLHSLGRKVEGLIIVVAEDSGANAMRAERVRKHRENS